MLHRIALRVLPSLSLAVTAAEVRKRKRVVMIVPGFVAFILYRILKQATALADPWILLTAAGVLCAATALLAYWMGRAVPPARVWVEDRGRLLAWLTGWIGFVYGVQLALLVLALLKVLRYDFLQHPEGPAMMALIIASTSVARDAFELGHLRTEERSGRPLLTFPDGRLLWGFGKDGMATLLAWGSVAAVAGAGLAWLAALAGEAGRDPLGQLVVVSPVGGTTALLAYLAYSHRAGLQGLRGIGWRELFRFWWWPGLAFAATYELVGLGAVSYVARLEWTVPIAAVVAGGACGLVTCYAAALGARRLMEDRLRRTVPEAVLRCPFVVGILSKTGGRASSVVASVDGLQRGTS